MLVFGDPQVTNAYSPYYTGPNDNPVKITDVARFSKETMTDVRKTLKALPADMPVYGLSMGDDVQYYGGFNATLETKIRKTLGASRMRLFSVIGNHDQDGKDLYKRAFNDPDFKVTDDCGVVVKYMPEVPVHLVAGEESNMKLTYKEDTFLLDKLFQLRGSQAPDVPGKEHFGGRVAVHLQRGPRIRAANRLIH